MKSDKFFSASRLAMFGLMVALAFVLSFAESLIPPVIPVPGVKLGLANLVGLCALYLMGPLDAAAVTLVRIILAGLTFGNGFSMLYALAGGVLSLIVMILLKHTGRFGVLGVSAAGGAAHNIGQILVAFAVLRSSGLWYYLPVLLVSGVVCGCVIGLIGGTVIRRLSRTK